jgi:KDO2-lipid IV(A) lauroyltransferase
MIQVLRANLAVVYGLPEDHPYVSESVTHLLQNTAGSFVDLSRALAAGPAAILAICRFDEAVLEIIQDNLASGRGIVFVSAHTCSFDIALLALSQLFPSVQALSNADPQGSSKTMNEIRARHGVKITPISATSLRQALKRLRSGGLVAIAADLPIEGGEELVFFDQVARLPAGHVRLAMNTGATLLVGTSHRVTDGRYLIEAATAPRPPSSGDRSLDAIHWAQSSLVILEGYIRRTPEEWLMPQPVWKGDRRHPAAERGSFGRSA